MGVVIRNRVSHIFAPKISVLHAKFVNDRREEVAMQEGIGRGGRRIAVNASSPTERPICDGFRHARNSVVDTTLFGEISRVDNGGRDPLEFTGEEFQQWTTTMDENSFGGGLAI